MDWLFAHWEMVSGISAALVGCGGALWRYWLRQQWRRLRQFYQRMVALPAQMNLLEARLDTVSLQVLPNGGASLADAIARAEATARRIEDSLQAHRAWTMAIHDVQGVAFFSTDERGSITYASAEMLELVGNRVLGNEWIAAIASPAERHQIVTEWREAVAQQRSFCEQVRFRSNAEEVAGSLEARPLFVAGEFVGFVGHYRPQR